VSCKYRCPTVQIFWNPVTHRNYIHEETDSKLNLINILAPPFLTFALYGGEWSASLTSCFTLGERAPGTQCIWGCVGPRAGWDTIEKRKSFTPARNWTLVIQPIAIPTEWEIKIYKFIFHLEINLCLKVYNYNCRCTSLPLQKNLHSNLGNSF
jgi:hypothetical protein